MPDRLPSLNALRAFEAAARHLSFSRAAEELHVTKAAVSHQVKALEEDLGLPLFRRLNRALLLTPAGQTLFPAISEALGLMHAAVARLKRQDRTGELVLTMLDSFAAIWLVPRLSRFRHAHPEIDVRIATSDDSIDFAHTDVDLAIRYGAGHWPEVHAERLMTEEIFPVCAPSLLKSGPPLAKPADLVRHTLLHDYGHETWRRWLLAVGETGVDADRGPGYQHSNLVLQAAEQGDGVAMARSVLAAEALASGRLVKPFDLSLPA
ncbi:MAG: transcriptional regulator GcvA, partial [Alphaproteobacteria bacterium]|nr:transcriptional regulator GcvA [Alphaproteobacteria bacterium]